MTKGYKEEFIYTNNTISEYQNDLYKVFLFKNSSCITELSLKEQILILEIVIIK